MRMATFLSNKNVMFAATTVVTDGSNAMNGSTYDIVSGAPEEAVRNKLNGERATDIIRGNWMRGSNQETIDYLNQVVGQQEHTL